MRGAVVLVVAAASTRLQKRIRFVIFASHSADSLACMQNDELSRRLFLARTGQLLLLTYASADWAPGQQPASQYPFTLGVASGDPEPDGVVLWTRLAPDPLAGGGMPSE